MLKLTEKTLIPMGLALSVIGGGSFWLSAVYQQLQANTVAIDKMQLKLDMLAGMRTDIEVIKTRVERIDPTQSKAQASKADVRTGPIISLMDEAKPLMDESGCPKGAQCLLGGAK